MSAAAKLGVSDVLEKDGPHRIDELAARLRCDAKSLERLIRVLASEGFFEEDADGRFSVTSLGQQLGHGRLKDLAIYTGDRAFWEPYASLAEAVKAGKTAFEIAHHKPLFEYLSETADTAKVYHRAVDAFTRKQAIALADAYDFSKVSTVADIGGGLGILLLALLDRFPHLDATLFDRSEVVDQARERLRDNPSAARMRFLAGDFFSSVPPDQDIYIVKHVVHNWPDDKAIRILNNCAKAAKKDSLILIVEGLLLPQNRQNTTRLLDLEMLALCGTGRERSKPEMRSLIAKAGLRLETSLDLAGMARLLVTTVARHPGETR